MAAVTQIRQPHSEGRAYYDKKLAEGKTRKEAVLVIGLVAYAPLGLGFLTGTIEPGSLDSANFGASNPRFQGQAGEANMASAPPYVVWLGGSVPSRPRWCCPGCCPRPAWRPDRRDPVTKRL